MLPWFIEFIKKILGMTFNTNFDTVKINGFLYTIRIKIFNL